VIFFCYAWAYLFFVGIQLTIALNLQFNFKVKIGLVRHFKVKHPFPKKFLLSADDVNSWFEEYQVAGLEITDIDLGGVDWEICYTSPLHRATGTAHYVYKGDVIIVDALKELDAHPFLNKHLRLPFIIWAIIVRVKSSFSNKTMSAFSKGIQSFVDELLLKSERNVLIVSHVFVMKHLAEELIKRGFKGGKMKTPDYGKLYIFKK
jgi:hypothetical protein